MTELLASGGDEVTVYVSSTSGSPAARIVDAAGRLRTESELAHPDGQAMAVVRATLPRGGSYRVLVRDPDARARFAIQLVVQRAR